MNQAAVASLRREYETRGLRRADLAPEPLQQFTAWFEAAVQADLPDANAMSLATATRLGRPSVRVVLLKGFDERGLVFFSNYNSEKGRHLAENPVAALSFYWVELERQVRITGVVKKSSREESRNYFKSRPRGSQLGAWVSRQSEVIDARQILESRLSEISERFEGREIDLPPRWGGYRLQPDYYEFWQGRANRLHDRFRYSRQKDGSWAIDRLAP